MSGLYFKEEQSMKFAWIGILLAILSALGLAYGVYQQLVIGQAFGNNPVPDHVLIVLAIAVPAIFVLMFWIVQNSKMITEVRSDAIIYRYPYFINKEKIIPFKDIDKAYVRSFNAMKDLGGHGIKIKSKTNRSITVAGKFGIQIILKDGGSILLGTQKHQAFMSAIDKVIRNLR